MKTLNDLKKDQTGIIIGLSFEFDDTTKRRLISYGFVRGGKIVLDNIAPMGDPKIYLILGYRVVIRNDVAVNVLITII